MANSAPAGVIMDGVVIYFPLLLAIIGAFVYALATNSKAAELGRCMFWVGVLAWLLRWPVIVGLR